MTQSIKTELEALERMGRVAAADQRPVHAEFGFEAIQPEPEDDPVAAGPADLATDLDNAWSRLKRTINPE